MIQTPNVTRFENCADLEAFITRVEEESPAKFITFSVDRHFNDKDWQPSPGNRVYWRWSGGSGMPGLDFTGTPFMFVGSKRLVCHRGRDLAAAQKQRYAEEKARRTDPNLGSQRAQHSKKVGCPAAISISKIATFPKFKVDDNRERSKKSASKMLRTALERDPIVWQTCYAVTHPIAHDGHALGEQTLPRKCRRATDGGFPPRRRARKTDLRKKCVLLTKQLVDRIDATEDQDVLRGLSEKLSALLEDLAPLPSNENGTPPPLPPQLEAKRLRVLTPTPLSQKLTQGTHTESMWEAYKVLGL